MVDKIYKRQIGFLLILVMPITKVVSLPSMLANANGQNCYFVILLFFLMDLISLLAIVKARDMVKGKNVFEIFESAFGKVVSKIIILMYLISFMLRIFPVYFEQKQLLSETIYFNMQRILVFLPTLLVASYIAYKGFTAIGRNADLLFMTAVGGFLTLFFLAVFNADFSNILPVLSVNVGGLFTSFTRYAFYFGDALFIMFMFNDIKKDKKSKSNTPVVMGLVISYIITLVFYVLFIAVFSSTSAYHLNAVEKIAKYNEAFAFLGRVDLLSVIPLLIGSVFNIAICLGVCIKIFRYVVGVKNRLLATIIITILACIMVGIFSFNARAMYNLYENVFSYIFIVLQYVIPFLLPIISLKEKRSGKVCLKMQR